MSIVPPEPMEETATLTYEEYFQKLRGIQRFREELERSIAKHHPELAEKAQMPTGDTRYMTQLMQGMVTGGMVTGGMATSTSPLSGLNVGVAQQQKTYSPYRIGEFADIPDPINARVNRYIWTGTKWKLHAYVADEGTIGYVDPPAIKQANEPPPWTPERQKLYEELVERIGKAEKMLGLSGEAEAEDLLLALAERVQEIEDYIENRGTP